MSLAVSVISTKKRSKEDKKTPVPDEKQRLRTRLLAARATTGAPTGAAAEVCRRLDRLPELATMRTVAGYAATVGELSIDAALQSLLDRGVTVCLPRVDGAALRLGAVRSLEELQPGWRGVREPPLDRTLRPAALDALIVPGVGFDRAGNRLGYGGGHFDRLLALIRRGAIVIGVALDEQLCTAIPTEAHDRPVDLIVTPTTTIRPR